MDKVSTPSQPVIIAPQPASIVNPRLRTFIIIGLILAAIFAIGFWLLNQPSKPPQLPTYTGAIISKQEQSSDAVTLETEVDNVPMKKIIDFYDQELAKSGWLRLSNAINTESEYAVAYESQDQQWGLSIHINAFPERGYNYVDLYLQRLGQN